MKRKTDIHDMMLWIGPGSFVPGMWAMSIFYHMFFPDSPEKSWETVPIIVSGIGIFFLGWLCSALVATKVWELIERDRK